MNDRVANLRCGNYIELIILAEAFLLNRTYEFSKDDTLNLEISKKPELLRIQEIINKASNSASFMGTYSKSFLKQLFYAS